MAKISDNPTKEEVLQFISGSIIYGNLGLFVGAGFSKAVLNTKQEIAWELLEKASDKLGIDYGTIAKDGADYPSIATQIANLYAANKRIEFRIVADNLKKEIAGLTAWYPDEAQRKKFSP